MKKKKRTPALPRVTVLAYSRRDLMRCILAVERLETLVEDLGLIARQLAAARVRRPKAQVIDVGMADETTATE